MRRALAAILTSAALLAAAGLAADPEAPGPTGLLCDLLSQTQGVEIQDRRPEFSWIVRSRKKDDLQTAYQIRVLREKDGEQVWDSGKQISDCSVAVAYGGPDLGPKADYRWLVRTWDRNGNAGDWSQPQRFRTADFHREGDPSTVTPARLVREVETRAAAPGKDGHAFVDFGRDAFAQPTLFAESAESGVVVAHLGEALEAPDRVSRKPGGSIRYLRVEIPVKEGKHGYPVQLPARDARRMPEGMAVMPFRYVELETPPGTTKAIVQRSLVHYPFADEAARFSCSDPRLTAVWELCRQSIKATSYCGIYVDGDRERLPYEADAYINQLGHYGVDREFTLARYSHEYLMRHSTWPTEWILHSVLMAWADYEHTGDTRSLALFYDDLKRKTLSALRRPDGLVTTVEPKPGPEVLKSVYSTRMQDIVDWPAAERDGFEMRPVNTVVNAFHWRALVLMARIARALGKPADAERFEADAEQTSGSIQAKLFDAGRGVYVDGEGSAHASLHGNMFPLAFGLVPRERAPGVAKFVRSRGMACSVYGAQYLLEALYDSGQPDHAVALMLAPGDRSWRHMVEDVKTTITLEAWDNKYKPNQDWNHAWGSAPANIIPRKLMGIEPLEPGFRRVRLRPQPGGLEWASMDLPTIRGAVHEEFRTSGGRLRLRVTLPANMQGDIHFLSPQGDSVRVDGKRKPAHREGDFLVVEGIGSGEHTLEAPL